MHGVTYYSPLVGGFQPVRSGSDLPGQADSPASEGRSFRPGWPSLSATLTVYINAVLFFTCAQARLQNWSQFPSSFRHFSTQKVLASRALPQTPMGSLQHFPYHLAGRRGAPHPHPYLGELAALHIPFLCHCLHSIVNTLNKNQLCFTMGITTSNPIPSSPSKVNSTMHALS